MVAVCTSEPMPGFALRIRLRPGCASVPPRRAVLVRNAWGAMGVEAVLLGGGLPCVALVVGRAAAEQSRA